MTTTMPRGVSGFSRPIASVLVPRERRITSHAWGAVPYAIDPQTGIVLFCVFPYTRKGRMTIRFPMGKGIEDATVWQTLTRELEQELAPRDRRQFSFRMGKELVYFELLSDERFVGGTHLKGFSAIELSGKVRDFRVIEGEGSLDEEVLDPPQWLEATETIRQMRERGLQTHRNAFFATLNFLAEQEALRREKRLFQRYGSLLVSEECQEVSTLASPDDWEFVREYTGSYPSSEEDREE